MDFRRVMRNSGYLLGFRLLSRFLSFLFLLFATHRLKPGAFGTLSFTLVTLELIITLGDFGVTRYGARELVRFWHERVGLSGKILAVQVITSAGMALVGLLVVLAISPPALKLEMLLLALASFFFYSLINTTESVFIARQKFFFSALFSFTGRLTYTTLGLIALASTGSIILVMWAFLAAVILETTIRLAVVRLRFTGFSFDFSTRDLWRMLRLSFPFAIAGVASMITFRGNMFVLDAFKGDVDVGIFNVATTLFSPFIWIGIIFSSTVFPGLTSEYARDPASARASSWQWYRLVALATIPLAVAVSLLSGPLTGLFPKDYAAAQPILIIMMWTVPPTLMTDVDLNILQVINKESAAAKSVVIGAVLSPAVSIMLVPWLGGDGAAAAMLVAMIARELYCRIVIRKSFLDRGVTTLFVRPLIAGAVMAAAGIALLRVSAWLAAAVSLAVFAVLVLAMKAVQVGEIKSILFRPAAADVNGSGNKYRKAP